MGILFELAAMGRKVFAQLCVVCQFCPFLDHEALHKEPGHLAHALAISQLDYCNVFYIGLPLKLQLVQNAVVQKVLEVLHVAHVTMMLHKLYWLPISFHVQLKVLVITFKVLYCMGPHSGH